MLLRPFSDGTRRRTRVAQWFAAMGLKTRGVVDETLGAKYDDIFNLPRVGGTWIEHALVGLSSKKYY